MSPQPLHTISHTYTHTHTHTHTDIFRWAQQYSCTRRLAGKITRSGQFHHHRNGPDRIGISWCVIDRWRTTSRVRITLNHSWQIPFNFCLVAPFSVFVSLQSRNCYLKAEKVLMGLRSLNQFINGAIKALKHRCHAELGDFLPLGGRKGPKQAFLLWHLKDYCESNVQLHPVYPQS